MASALERFLLWHGYSLSRWLPSLELHGVWRDHQTLCAASKAHSADVGSEDGLVKKLKAQSAARRGHSGILARKHHQVLRSTSQLVHVHNVGHSEASDIVMRARTCRDAAIRRLEKAALCGMSVGRARPPPWLSLLELLSWRGAVVLKP